MTRMLKTRWVLLALLALTFAGAFIFIKPGTVNALPCVGNDKDYFPYGFICRGVSNPYDTSSFEVSSRELSSNPDPLGNDGVQTLDTGVRTVKIRGRYDSQGPPRSEKNGETRRVLVWMTVDTFSEGTVTSLSGGGSNTSLDCPTDRGGNPGVVYNQSGLTGSSSQDASPRGYTGSSGLSNCSAGGGKMAYWANQSYSSSYYNLDINLGNVPNGRFCIRMNVSVYYPNNNNQQIDQYGLFPSAGATPGGSRSVASHLAQQSDRYCYKTGDNKEPDGNLSFRCSGGTPTSFRAVGYDPDSQGSNVNYKIFRSNTGQEEVNGVTNKATTAYTGRNFVDDRTYILKVQDLQDGQYYTVDEQPVDCGSTPGPAPTSGTVDCNNYYLTVGKHTLAQVSVYPKNVDYAGSARPASPGQIKSSPSWSPLNAAPPGSPGEVIPAKQWTNSSESTQSITQALPAPVSSEWNVYFESWYHVGRNSSGVDQWRYNGLTSDPEVNCYSAKCTSSLTGGTGPNGIFVVGDTIHVNVAMENTGKQTLAYNTLGDGVLGTTADGNRHSVQPGYYLPPGTTGYSSYDVATGGSPTTVSTNPYPDLYGKFALGAACGKTATVYQHFRLTPSITITPTSDTPGEDGAEDPDTITWEETLTQETGGAENNYSGKVYSEMQNALYKNGVFTGQFIPYQKTEYETKSFSASWRPGAVVAGDKFCTDSNTYPGTGYIGPGGSRDVVYGEQTSSNNACFGVYNQPYVTFYGADVSAGGSFNNVNGGGGIYGYSVPYHTSSPSNAETRAAGTSSQFGLSASDIILGARSASLRPASSTDPKGPAGLTFAADVAGAAPDSLNSATKYGGQNAISRALPSYFSERDIPSGVTPQNISSVSNLSQADNGTPTGTVQYFAPSTGKFEISGNTTIGNNVQKVVYVDGDVYIKGNISVSNSFGSIASIPGFYLYVNGNIYVDRGVTSLDGVYAAQPSNPTAPATTKKGIFATCATATGPYQPNKIYDNCSGSQLVVNGAVVARKVLFDRSFSSLRYSRAGEALVPNNGSRDCREPGTVPYLNCSAEIINYSPQIYLGQPPLKPTQGPPSNTFDYITSLAPVL